MSRSATPVGPFAPVLVGVDASSTATAAVELAAREAVRWAAPLLILHVREARQTDAAQRLVTAAASRVNAWYPELVVRTEVATGCPAAALLDRSRDAALLVVGHRGRRGGAATAGSVALRVLGRAAVPVIVHRPFDDAAQDPRPVLVGVDATVGSEPVVAFAFAQAAARGVPLLAEHVWSVPADAVPARFGQGVTDAREARAEAERRLADALAAWSEKYPDVVVRKAVRHSLDAAVALTAATHTAGLVVVGQTRVTGPRRMAGSVAQFLVHRAGCPVAVIPTA